ncbi:MAG: hypothetical protein RLZZ248_1189 [Bacteroidota bacterium]
MERISLFQLNTFIKRALALNFNNAVWVTAEIAQVSNSRGHIYLELVEKSLDTQAVIAKARGNIWKSTASQLEQKLGPLFKDILQEGTEILFSTKVTFHELYGISLQIDHIDPAFTMGKLEMERQETINYLQTHGKLHKNGQYSLPPVIQHIAVLSSATAAGYGDFKAHLLQNEYGYQIQWDLFPVAVQGTQVTQEIITALNSIQNKANPYDAVVIIRGGGSKLDLAAFDDKDLCVAIADFTQPIIVGIGHERDQSIADLVAHTALKTPTAVADFILYHNLQFEEKILQWGQQIQTQAEAWIREKTDLTNRLTIQLKWASQSLLTSKVNQINLAADNIQRNAWLTLKNSDKDLTIFEKQIAAAHPQNILKRGYALIRNEEGSILDFEKINLHQSINIELIDGIVKTTVQEKQKNG